MKHMEITEQMIRDWRADEPCIAHELRAVGGGEYACLYCGYTTTRYEGDEED